MAPTLATSLLHWTALWGNKPLPGIRAAPDAGVALLPTRHARVLHTLSPLGRAKVPIRGKCRHPVSERVDWWWGVGW